MITTYELFSPERAMSILAHNNKRNRKLRQAVVDAYALDMKHGSWTECADPIVFSENNGDLISGQHRLSAVVKSGKSQMFIVIRDFPQQAAVNIDTQLPRSFSDNAKFSGVDDISSNLLGVARGIDSGCWRPATHRLSMSEKLRIVEKHRRAANWAISALPRDKNVVRSLLPIIAVGRAFYVEHNLPRLNTFCEILKSGIYDTKDDIAAITMRNWIIANPHYCRPLEWDDSFRKIQNAIWYFMRKEPLSHIRRIAEDRYPLPDNCSLI